MTVERLLKVPPHEMRNRLQELEDSHRCDEIKELPEMRLFEERNFILDTLNENDCWIYVLKNSNARNMGIPNIDLLKARTLIDLGTDSREGGIVVYLGSDFAPWAGRMWRVQNHVGRIIQVKGNKIIIRSKFGTSDVYEHPFNYVPTFYGEYAKFVFMDGLFDGIK